MPNKIIYLNTIKNLEKDAGIPLISSADLEKRLQDAWKNDKSEAKVDYLAEYRKIFREVLTAWSDHELATAIHKRSDTMPNFKDCLWKTDQALKVCAMAALPELRENADVLSNMTFGVLDSAQLRGEFGSVRRKYMTLKGAENLMKARQATAYEKYKKDWEQTNTRNIVELVSDKDALQAMPQEEKIDYALALNAYRNDRTLPHLLDDREKELIDGALADWEKEIGCGRDESLADFVSNQYFQHVQKFTDDAWIKDEVSAAIKEYNKVPNYANQEIAQYKKMATDTAEKKRKSESTVPTEGITDDTAEMVGDFFAQEDLTQELSEMSARKERLYFNEKVEAFNEQYSLRISKELMYATVEKVSGLMIKAQQEKESFYAEDSVVVIENGEEKHYTKKEYYKDALANANKKYAETIKKLEEERAQAEKDRQGVLDRIEKWKQSGAEINEAMMADLKASGEAAFKEKSREHDKAFEKATKDLQKEISEMKGGIVIERDGETEKRHKASQYYETHETKKEQQAYTEYQKMYVRFYRDACQNLKEKNYAAGRVSDFSMVAKDVDKLFKTAMYVANVYDNDKNKEVIQKCNFGGFTPEQLATATMNFKGDSWAADQTSEAAWTKQKTGARQIISQWSAEEKKNPKVKPGNRVRSELDGRRAAFEKGELTRKEMLDYTIAATAHMEKSYPTRLRRWLSFIQYGREKKAVLACRTALGLKEGDSLRIAMSNEYERLSRYMSKEEVFKGVGTRASLAPTFQEEKRALENEHKQVQDKIKAEKVTALEQLKSKDREPISIPSLNERKTILFQKPRVEPIPSPAQPQQNLNIKK